MKTKFYCVFCIAVIATTFLPIGNLLAQRAYPVRTSDLSDEDWTSWRIAILTIEEADKASRKGRYTNALNLYKKAIEHLKKVKKNAPSWNKKGVQNRFTELQKRITEMEKLIQEAKTIPAQTENKATGPDVTLVQEIAELKLQLENTKKQNIRLRQDLDTAKKTVQQVQELLNEKNEMEKKYSLLLVQYNELKSKNQQGETDRMIQVAWENEKKRADSLAAELEKSRKSTSEIQNSLEQTKNKFSSLEKESANLKKQIAEIDNLQKEIRELQNKIKSERASTSVAEEKNQKEIKRLKEEVSAKSKQVDEANEALTKLRSNMSLDQAARQLEQSVAALKAENANLKQQITALRTQNEKQIQSANQQTDDLMKANEMVHNLNSHSKKLEGELKTAKENVSVLSERLKKSEREIDTAHHNLDALKKERDSFAEKLSQAPSEATVRDTNAALTNAQNQLKTLQEKYQELTISSKQKEKEIADFKNKYSSVENELIIAKDSIKKIQDQLKTSTYSAKALKVAEGKIEELENTIRVQNSILTDKNTDIAKIISDLNSTKKSFQLLENEKKELLKKLDDGNKQIDLLTKQCDELKKLSQTDKTKAAAEIVALQKQISSVTAQKNGLEVQLKKISSKAVSQTKHFNEELTLITKDKEISSSEITALKKQLTELLKKVNDSSLALDELSKVKTQLTEELKLEKSKVSELEKQIAPNAKTALELQKANTALASANDTNKVLSKEISDLKNVVNLMKKDSSALLKSVMQENNILKTELENERKNSKNKLSEKEQQKLTEQIQGYQQELLNNKNTIDKIQAERTKLNIQITELGKQLSELKRENSVLKSDPTKSEVDIKNKEYAEKIQKLQDKTTLAETRIIELEKQLADAVKQGSAITRKATELEQNNASLAHRIQSLNEEKKILEDKIVLAEQNLSAEKKKLEESLQKKEYEDVAKSDKKSQEKKDTEELLSKINVLSSKCEKMKKENTLLNAKIAELTNAINSKQQDLSNINKRALAMEKNTTEQIKEAEKAYTKKLADTEKDLKLLSDRIAALNTENKKANEIILSQKTEISTLNKKLSDTTEVLNKVAAEKQSEANVKLAQLLRENESLKKALDNITAEKAQTHEVLLKKQSEYQQLDLQYTELKNVVASDTRFKKLSDEMKKLSDSFKTLTENNQKLNNDYTNLARDKSEIDKRNADLRKQLDTSAEQIVLLKKQLEKWERGNDEILTDKLAEKNKVIDVLTQDYLTLQKKNADLELQLAEEKANVSLHKKNAEGARKELAEMKKNSDTVSKNKIVPIAVSTGNKMKPDSEYAAEAAAKMKALKEEINKKKASLSQDQIKKFNTLMEEAKKLEKTNLFDEAISKYLFAAEANPYAWEAHFGAMKLYLQANKKDAAFKEYQKAVKLGMPADSELEKILKNDTK